MRCTLSRVNLHPRRGVFERRGLGKPHRTVFACDVR